jgi:hypothetical protein
MSLEDKLLGDTILHPHSRAAQALKRQGVSRSFELDRILEIPRRASDPKLYPDLTPVFAKEGGKLSLWPMQSWALIEAESQGGLFAPLAVGGGKSLICCLLPDVLHSERTVLFIPPQLRAQFLNRDLPFYSKHFHIPSDKIIVVAYSELSSPKKADILDQIKPDLIIADECHNLRYSGGSSARTRRFLRFMEENPNTRFCALSGTITRRSVKDYQHLIQLALRQFSPLPNRIRELADWAAAIDSSDDPMPPGALKALVYPEDGDSDTQEAVRKGYRRRLVETPGVVSTTEGSLEMSLVIQAQFPKTPFKIGSKLEEVRETWMIEEEVLEEPTALARVCRQLAAGFYYRWVWPNGEKDWEWLEARSKWHKEVQTVLKRAEKGLDSPLLVYQAASKGRIPSTSFAAWAAVKDRPVPPTEAVWLDNFLVNEALSWAKSCSPEQPGIIWYEHDAVGKKLSEMGDIPLFAGGTEASALLSNIDAKKNPVIVCSIKAHGTGKNLQMYCRGLITTPPASGLAFEQLLGRMHRPGQEADEVWFDVYMHTYETRAAFDQALGDARYIESTQGQKQKLLYATRIMK